MNLIIIASSSSLHVSLFLQLKYTLLCLQIYQIQVQYLSLFKWLLIPVFSLTSASNEEVIALLSRYYGLLLLSVADLDADKRLTVLHC